VTNLIILGTVAANDALATAAAVTTLANAFMHRRSIRSGQKGDSSANAVF
jgi:hypothetical protein